MSFSEQLKMARVKAGYTQQQIADFMGITKSAYCGYETGKRQPDVQKIKQIAGILNVSGDILLETGISDNEPTIVELEAIRKYRALDSHGKEIIDILLEKEYQRCQLKDDRPDLTIAQQDMRVVRYYQRMASAGTGQVVFEDMPTERIQIPDIPEYRCVSYAIGVNGDSMEPLYYDGDILLVETTLQIEIGEIGIFIVDGEAFVKQLGEGKLISLNKKYKDIPLTEYSNCMGKVVGKLEAQ